MSPWSTLFSNAEPAVQAAIVSGIILTATTFINFISSLLTKLVEIRSKNSEWVRGNKQKSIEEIILRANECNRVISSFRREIFQKNHTMFFNPARTALTRQIKGVYTLEKFSDAIISIFESSEAELISDLRNFRNILQWLDGAGKNNWFWLERPNHIRNTLEQLHLKAEALEDTFLDILNEYGNANGNLIVSLTIEKEDFTAKDRIKLFRDYEDTVFAINNKYRSESNISLKKIYEEFDASLDNLMSLIDSELRVMPGVSARTNYVVSQPPKNTLEVL